MLKQENQKERRQGIEVGSSMSAVSPASYWYRSGHFKNDDEARGAFKLAYQQGMDGMGKTVREWMGMSFEEFDSWMCNETLPPKKLQK